MSDAPQTLELIEVLIDPIARPSNSLIVADASFMTTLKTVEATVAAIKITDAQSAQQAADLLTRLTKAGSALEKQRVALKAPYLALMTQIDTAAKGAAGRIDAAKRTLSKLQTDFALEQQRIAREAEAKRQRELKDLEEKLAREKKEAEEKAQALADQVRRENEEKARVLEAARVAGLPVTEEEDWGDVAPVAPAEPPQKSETEKAIEAIRHAPAPLIAKASGVREIVELYPFLVDIDQVPDCFVQKSLRLAQLQSVYCRGFKDGDKIPVVSGIRFEVQRKTVSTGKAGF